MFVKGNFTLHTEETVKLLEKCKAAGPPVVIEMELESFKYHSLQDVRVRETLLNSEKSSYLVIKGTC